MRVCVSEWASERRREKERMVGIRVSYFGSIVLQFLDEMTKIILRKKSNN